MTRLTAGICMVLAVAVGLTAIASDPETKTKVNASDAKKSVKKTSDAADTKPRKKTGKSGSGDRWMELKLASSQLIFAELTRGNLEGVAKQAKAGRVVDALEYWLRTSEFRKQSEYQKQLNLYQFATRELARQADDGNIDGALESWLDVNRSCVECHKLLRDHGHAESVTKPEKKPEALSPADKPAGIKQPKVK